MILAIIFLAIAFMAAIEEDAKKGRWRRVKISCTREEKVKIIDAFMDANFCFCPNDNADCVYDSGCYECIEDSIDWEIEDGEQDV